MRALARTGKVLELGTMGGCTVRPMGLKDIGAQVKSMLFPSSGLTLLEEHELAMDTSDQTFDKSPQDSEQVEEGA
jgi:hypothetical protein